MLPLWFSSYVLDLRVPNVSLTTENIADFLSAYLLGNLLQMAFRFWAFRRWVFPDEMVSTSDRALESALTSGGIAEAPRGRVRSTRAPPQRGDSTPAGRNPPAAQRSSSASNTS